MFQLKSPRLANGGKFVTAIFNVQIVILGC